MQQSGLALPLFIFSDGANPSPRPAHSFTRRDCQGTGRFHEQSLERNTAHALMRMQPMPMASSARVTKKQLLATYCRQPTGLMPALLPYYYWPMLKAYIY